MSTPPGTDSAVESALSEAASFVERTLDALLPAPAGPEARLLEAMRYAALHDGRRLRAFLVLQAGRLYGVDRRALGRVAAAVACAHAYGFAHDALPAIGGESGAEGATVHKSFGEATAILAGDALLAFAFELIGSSDAIGDPFIRSELVVRLAQSVGHAGMIGGRMLETLFAGASADGLPPLPEISRLERMKTAALITFCCEAGAILGRASPQARHALFAYGQDLGLAFQITSDLAAWDGKSAHTRKPAVVSALGTERAHAQAVALAAQARRHLDLFDEKAELLRAATDFVVRPA